MWDWEVLGLKLLICEVSFPLPSTTFFHLPACQGLSFVGL
jgi:hypothetical protein